MRSGASATVDDRNWKSSFATVVNHRAAPFTWIHVVAYASTIAGAVALFLVIRSYGSTLTAPPPSIAVAARGGDGGAAANPLLTLLVTLTAVVVVGRLLGWGLRALGQPPVIGEILAGISLGPSLLGRVAPDIADFLMPASGAPLLGVVAQLGVILFMFRVGLELNADVVRDRVQATIATSHTSILVPFVLGSALALVLYPRFSTSDVSFTSFSLFMGVAMSVTAFPVLARILTDRGLIRTELGSVALTCAAVDDATAWCLLALIVGVTRSQVHDAIGVLASAVVFLAIALVFVRRVLRWVLRRFKHEPPGDGALAFVLAGVLLFALTTEAIGLHAIFGAFLFGAIIRHDSALARSLSQNLDAVVTILLLPAYFAFTGMRTQVGLVSGLDAWLMCGLITMTATIGKVGGALVAARVTGMAWRPALSLGVLMNTRGLMELIVLNIGLDLGVLSPQLFTMMVLMAIATTMATTPVLHLLGLESFGPVANGRFANATSR